MNNIWIEPDWPAPARVKALSTTRIGGVGKAPYDSLNLGTHVGDDPAVVAANRARLRGLLGPQTRVAARVNGEPGLWVSFEIDGDPYWLGLSASRFERHSLALRRVLTLDARMAAMASVSASPDAGSGEVSRVCHAEET